MNIFHTFCCLRRSSEINVKHGLINSRYTSLRVDIQYDEHKMNHCAFGHENLLFENCDYFKSGHFKSHRYRSSLITYKIIYIFGISTHSSTLRRDMSVSSLQSAGLLLILIDTSMIISYNKYVESKNKQQIMCANVYNRKRSSRRPMSYSLEIKV